MASGGEGTTVWYQREVSLSSKKRGCHYITEEIYSACKSELSKIKVGVANIHIKHTSASIVLNENYDRTVLDDMEMMLNRLAPENINYKHSLEGPDDMPAHVKAALMGSSVSVPITNGKFNLGTWQGVWLCEHRDHGVEIMSTKSFMLIFILFKESGGDFEWFKTMTETREIEKMKF